VSALPTVYAVIRYAVRKVNDIPVHVRRTVIIEAIESANSYSVISCFLPLSHNKDRLNSANVPS